MLNCSSTSGFCRPLWDIILIKSRTLFFFRLIKVFNKANWYLNKTYYFKDTQGQKNILRNLFSMKFPLQFPNVISHVFPPIARLNIIHTGPTHSQKTTVKDSSKHQIITFNMIQYHPQQHPRSANFNSTQFLIRLRVAYSTGPLTLCFDRFHIVLYRVTFILILTYHPEGGAKTMLSDIQCTEL